MKKIILFIIINLCLFNIYGQIVFDTFSYEVYNEHENYRIGELKIINNSEDEYISWIILDTNSKSINAFFRQIPPDRDFSWINLFYEQLIDESFPVYIGTTFICCIQPGKSFTYQVLGKEPFDFMKKYIVIFKKKEVENILRISFQKKHFFQNDKIVLISNEN